MFKQRLLTALILIPLVLWAIEQANVWFLSALMLGLWMLAGWEWLALIPLTKHLPQGLFLVSLLGCLCGCLYALPLWLMAGLVFWAGVACAVITYPRSQRVWGYPAVVIAGAWILLPLMPSTIYALYQLPHGRDLIIYLLFLIWATDSGAYFAGKMWGAHRLIPHVSPGKTMEGVLGGLFLALAVAGLGGFWFAPTSWCVWIGLALLTALMSMLGDLSISMLKRRCQLKDTGHIFPGHGGVLDRLDSLVAAAPLFYLGFMSFVSLDVM